MSTTTYPADLLEQMLAEAADRVICQDREVLRYGLKHSILALGGAERFRTITRELLDWRNLHYFLIATGALQAWEADQDARSVPIVCPDWCGGLHGHKFRGGEFVGGSEDVITPFAQVEPHVGDLAAGRYVDIGIEQVQAHPDFSEKAGPMTVQVSLDRNNEGLVNLSPDKLAVAADDYRQTFDRALQRLWEITEGEYGR